jgi:hypothetical protein
MICSVVSICEDDAVVFIGRSAVDSERSCLQMQTSLQSTVGLSGIKELGSEKVRESFDPGEMLLFVA